MHAYRADAAFDGDRAMPGGALVLVSGGTIAGVEPAGAPGPDGCPVTYLPGTTLLPGLIDTHVHLCGDASARALDRIPELSAGELDEVIVAALRIHLAAGVTTVRDLGDHRWAVADRHRVPLDDGPTVLAAGPPVTSVGGHCWTMGGEAAGADGLRRAVRERAEHGADVVKVMASGGAMTAGTDVLAPQFSRDELRLLVTGAHAAGLPVTAHAHGLGAVRDSLAAGVDGIEHCSCMTASGFETPPNLVADLAAAGTFVAPTLGRDMDRLGGKESPQIQAMLARAGVTYDDRLAQVADLHRGGAALVAGSDAGINLGKPHGVLVRSVADLVRCGVPPERALSGATGLAADACGLGGRTGRLRAGLAADLLAVGGDPLSDVAALADVRLVVARGRPVRRTGSPRT